MKTLRAFLEESEALDEITRRDVRRDPKQDRKDLESHMDRRYQQDAPDLPRRGQWHHATATDHLSDRAYDELRQGFYGKIPKHLNLKASAKKVVSQYADNDSALSKRNDAKASRRWAKSLKPPKPPKVKSWDSGRPKNKGIGSY